MFFDNISILYDKYYVFEGEFVYPWYLTCMNIGKGTPYDLSEKIEIPPVIFKNTLFIKIYPPARKPTFCQFRRKYNIEMLSKTTKIVKNNLPPIQEAI